MAVFFCSNCNKQNAFYANNADSVVCVNCFHVHDLAEELFYEHRQEQESQNLFKLMTLFLDKTPKKHRHHGKSALDNQLRKQIQKHISSLQHEFSFNRAVWSQEGMHLIVACNSGCAITPNMKAKGVIA